MYPRSIAVNVCELGDFVVLEDRSSKRTCLSGGGCECTDSTSRIDRLEESSPIAFLVATILQVTSFGLRCYAEATSEKARGYQTVQLVPLRDVQPIPRTYHVLDSAAYVAVGVALALTQRSHLSDSVVGGSVTADGAWISLVVVGGLVGLVALATEFGHCAWPSAPSFATYGAGTPLVRALLLTIGAVVLANFSGGNIASLVAPGITAIAVIVAVTGVVRANTSDVIWQFASSGLAAVSFAVMLGASTELPCGNGVPESVIAPYGA
jgi:hypothetical protein